MSVCAIHEALKPRHAYKSISLLSLPFHGIDFLPNCHVLSVFHQVVPYFRCLTVIYTSVAYAKSATRTPLITHSASYEIKISLLTLRASDLNPNAVFKSSKNPLLATSNPYH